MIKKLSIYIFVMLYIVAMLRPIAPFVEYAINYDYISKVLCINKDKPELNCNGKCQLMEKLAQQQEDDFNSLRINMDEYPIGFVNLTTFSEKRTYSPLKERTLFSFHKNYSFLFNTDVFHPPTV